ncbi:Putative defensin-like protein 157 [Linum perenne]
MAKFSFVQVFMVFLIFSAATQIQETSAQKRCVETLYPSGCTLTDCGKQCYVKHQSRGGQCIANQAGVYACICVWDC